jgi:hypothetical protein
MAKWTDRELSRLRMVLDTEQQHSVHEMARLLHAEMKKHSVVAIGHKLRELISSRSTIQGDTFVTESGEEFPCIIIGGYVHIYLDDSACTPAHHYVWSCAYGEIPKGYHIHHINNNRLDNRLCNLALMDASEHIRWHHAGKPAETTLMFSFLQDRGLWEEFLSYRQEVIQLLNG